MHYNMLFLRKDKKRSGTMDFGGRLLVDEGSQCEQKRGLVLSEQTVPSFLQMLGCC